MIYLVFPPFQIILLDITNIYYNNIKLVKTTLSMIPMGGVKFSWPVAREKLTEGSLSHAGLEINFFDGQSTGLIVGKFYVVWHLAGAKIISHLGRF